VEPSNRDVGIGDVTIEAVLTRDVNLTSSRKRSRCVRQRVRSLESNSPPSHRPCGIDLNVRGDVEAWLRGVLVRPILRKPKRSCPDHLVRCASTKPVRVIGVGVVHSPIATYSNGVRPVY